MTTHIINNEIIHVEYDDQRAFWGGDKYHALLDSYDPTPIDDETPAYNPVGYGSTEEEALNDLLCQLED